MKFDDYIIHPASRHTGKIQIDDMYDYEVYGPFGQGYNIKVQSQKDKGVLNYHWRDGPGAYVKTKTSKYELSTYSIYRDTTIILEMNKDEFEPVDDQAVMALFIINHFFSRKTGIFTN